MWQDSSQTTAVTSIGDPIGYWEDKTGNGNDFTQTDSARRPTWQGDHVQFQNDWLVGTDLSANTTEGTMVARVLVTDFNAPGGTGGGMFTFTSMDTTTSAAHYAAGSLTGTHYCHFMSTVRPACNSFSNYDPGTSAVEHTITHQKATSTALIVRCDGTEEYNVNQTTGNMGTAPLVGATRRSGIIADWSINDADIRGRGVLVYNTQLTGSLLNEAEAFIAG